MELHEIKDYIYKRLEEMGLYSYDVGNRSKWYYSSPDFRNDGYVEEETEIQMVFVDWMGSITEIWVTHDFSLHPIWYKVVKNNKGKEGLKMFRLNEKDRMLDYVKQQIRQLDRVVIERNEKLKYDRKMRKKQDIVDCARNWDVK